MEVSRWFFPYDLDPDVDNEPDNVNLLDVTVTVFFDQLTYTNDVDEVFYLRVADIDQFHRRATAAQPHLGRHLFCFDRSDQAGCAE